MARSSAVDAMAHDRLSEQLAIGVCPTIGHYPHDLIGEGDQCETKMSAFVATAAQSELFHGFSSSRHLALDVDRNNTHEKLVRLLNRKIRRVSLMAAVARS
jgi:hypothetical protein